MKKILIIQLLGKSFGGVWQVNKVIGEKFVELGYDVSIAFLRENKVDIDIEHDPRLKLHTINPQDNWDLIPRKKDVLTFKTSLIKYIKEQKKVYDDYKKLNEYIKSLNPNYIITSHYQLLNGIPKEYLNKTIHEQHTSFEATYSHRNTRKTLNKYNGKIKIVWLSKTSKEAALSKGFKDCYSIYNSVRFNSQKVSKVTDNKKLVTLARFSYEKRIDLMIDIVKDIFKDKKFKDWSFDIYGAGGLEKKLKEKINDRDRINFMGKTDNPQKVLLNSSINLNTSLFEGFPLAILEANECGVPTISFDFGESSKEVIINNKTGIIAKDIADYKNQLKKLMLDNNKLLELSKNCKEFNNNFKIDSIIKDWIKLFEIIDNKK